MRAQFIKDFLNESSRDDEIRYAGNYIPLQYHFETGKEKKTREAREKIQNNKAYLGTFKSIKELENYTGVQDNDWVIRSADGGGSLLLFDGDLISEKDINEIKTYYKIDQDLHYFQGRPITFARWKNLPNDLKFASRRKKL
jgi:hypothetical protein